MVQCKVCNRNAPAVDTEGNCEACAQKKIFAEISKRIPDCVTEVLGVSPRVFR